MKAGYHGGRQAAWRLSQDVKSFLHEQGSLTRKDLTDPLVTILLYVYADIRIVAMSYCQSRVLEHPAEFEPFFLGFNSGMPNSQAILADINQPLVRWTSFVNGKASEMSITQAYHPRYHPITIYRYSMRGCCAVWNFTINRFAATKYH